MTRNASKRTADIAVFSVGLDTYWKQFPGLLDVMTEKHAQFLDMLNTKQTTIHDFGMVDNVNAAYGIIGHIKAVDPDICLIDMTTYATSATCAVIMQCLDCPVILVALQPQDALDWKNGTTFQQLCNDDICAVPEFTGVAIRMGHPVADVIVGTRHNDPLAQQKLDRWCRIASVRHNLRKAQLGLMGHVLNTMLDMHVDPALVTRTFGAHVLPCEPDQVFAYLRKLDDQDQTVRDMSDKILSFFQVAEPGADPLASKLRQEDLLTSAKVAVALEQFIAEQQLDGLAYYYEAEPDSPMRKMVTNFIVGNSLLTSNGFPMCGEFDLKTCIAMLIMDRLDIGGSFAEFHPVDFNRNTILVGHDGPHHLKIADRKPVLRSLQKYHGKPGAGAGVEFSIKHGPITILSIGLGADANFKFVVAEGEAVEGPIPATGNTNTHASFGPDVRDFLSSWCLAGPTHHFALGIGHHAEDIRLIADSFQIPCQVIS